MDQHLAPRILGGPPASLWVRFPPGCTGWTPFLSCPCPLAFRNFPEAPGRMTPCCKRRRRWAEGWRGGEGTGKTVESCFLSRNAQVRDCSRAPPVPLRSWEEGADLRILLCCVCHSGELRKKRRIWSRDTCHPSGSYREGGHCRASSPAPHCPRGSSLGRGE